MIRSSDLLFLDSLFSPVYLGSAALISFLWLKKQGHQRTFQAHLGTYPFLKKESWLLDLGLTLLNILILKRTFEEIEHRSFLYVLGWNVQCANLHGNRFFESVCATLVTMLSIDLGSYWVHRLLHRGSFLWSIHMLHHSAEALTPLTTYRQNPLERLFLGLGRGLFAGLGLMLWRCFFPSGAPVITVYGLGFGFFLYMFTANLHHWPIPVHYPKWVSLVFLSPHLHHLHHSRKPEHYNCNYGTVFSIWDRLFKTYRDFPVHMGQIEFGLTRNETSLPASRFS